MQEEKRGGVESKGGRLGRRRGAGGMTRRQFLARAGAASGLAVLGGGALFPTDAKATTTFRSTLYPEDWLPLDAGGTKTSDGKFLHDFSYAGYRKGDRAIPSNPGSLYVNAVTDSRFAADNTGATDTTSDIQAAINYVGSNGGGVVYLPAGTYKIRPQGTNSHALRLDRSKVVLRGAGSSGSTVTRLFNDQRVMRQKNVIMIGPDDDKNAWYDNESNPISIASDLPDPTRKLPLASVSGLAVGDEVVVRADCTEGFREDHGMSGYWPNDENGAIGLIFYRQITAIDSTSKTVTLDIPTRYYLKTRDNARIYETVKNIYDVGVENLAIGMRENNTSGTSDGDYDTPGTGAYEMHQATAIRFNRVRNGWVKGVRSYRPSVNSREVHLLSRGVWLRRSTRSITIEDCHLTRPQYKGAGGNGYLFHLTGGESLVKDSTASYGRHNFMFSDMSCAGNVMLRCSTSNGRLPCDFHRYLSPANLVDGAAITADFWEAKNRTSTSNGAGHTATQSVFWNTAGNSYASGKDEIIRSYQYGWGYVIGTRGSAYLVDTNDHKEGIGNGQNLEPQSLYEDQKAKRAAR